MKIFQIKFSSLCQDIIFFKMSFLYILIWFSCLIHPMPTSIHQRILTLHLLIWNSNTSIITYIKRFRSLTCRQMATTSTLCINFTVCIKKAQYLLHHVIYFTKLCVSGGIYKQAQEKLQKMHVHTLVTKYKNV